MFVGVWGVSARIQVSRKEFHTHIHLNYIRVEFLSCIKKNKNKNKNKNENMLKNRIPLSQSIER